MNPEHAELVPVWNGALWRAYWHPLPAPPLTRDDLPVLKSRAPARVLGHASRDRMTPVDQRVLECLRACLAPLTLRQLVAMRAASRCGCQGSLVRLMERQLVQVSGRNRKAITYGLVPR